MVKIRTKKPTVLTLEAIQNDWKDCTKCEIGKHVRNHVFIDTIPKGLDRADIVFIGEGPGVVEDVKGLLFVGPAGKLLREAIQEANPECPHCQGTGVIEEDTCPYCLGHGAIRIAFLNLLVCRPYAKKASSTENRPPEPGEVHNCMPRLVAMIKVLNPAIVVLLGQEPRSCVSSIREELYRTGLDYDNQQLQFTFMKHPSALLRQIGEDRTSSLYKQYVDQLKHDFEWYYNCNKLDAMQREGARAGQPRKERK